MKKLTLIAAAAAGYVLGSRAGRERYEQIKTQATKAWNTGPVQSAVDEVQTQAKHAASDVGAAVKDKVGGGSDDEPPTTLPTSTNGLS